MNNLARPALCSLLVLVSCGVVGCKKTESDAPAAGATAHGRPALEGEPEPPKPDRDLTAKELPLTEDFRKAATKLVTADNYREQIARVERELAQLAQREERQRKLDAEESSH